MDIANEYELDADEKRERTKKYQTTPHSYERGFYIPFNNKVQLCQWCENRESHPIHITKP